MYESAQCWMSAFFMLKGIEGTLIEREGEVLYYVLPRKV